VAGLALRAWTGVLPASALDVLASMAAWLICPELSGQRIRG